MAALTWPYKLSPKVGRRHDFSDSAKKFTITAQIHVSFSSPSTDQVIKFPVSKTSQLSNTTTTSLLLYATVNRRPKGFGPSSKKTKKNKKSKSRSESDEDEDDDDDDSDDEDEAAESGVIPEIVTNRMISRIGLTVGIPLFVGLLFFPLFYYLKVVLKIDIPSWLPVIVSFIFFGTALLGVSYGIVSSSWDPLREGSLLGWNEAQKNWPVFWQSLWSDGGSSKKQ